MQCNPQNDYVICTIVTQMYEYTKVQQLNNFTKQREATQQELEPVMLNVIRIGVNRL